MTNGNKRSGAQAWSDSKGKMGTIKDWGTNNFIDKVVDGGDEIEIKKA